MHTEEKCMSLTRHFRRQFEYGDWANREVQAALQESPIDKSVRLLAHILAAEALWFDRVHATPNAVVWPEWTIQECGARQAAIARRWRDYVSGLTEQELRRPVDYTNSK